MLGAELGRDVMTLAWGAESFESRLPNRVDYERYCEASFSLFYLLMAHIAKLGALTDELVTLLTSISAKVSIFRSVLSSLFCPIYGDTLYLLHITISLSPRTDTESV